MGGVEAFVSLCLHKLSELYDHLDFIAYIFHLILYLGQMRSYLMRILIISFTNLSKREERVKCNKQSFVLVHPMPCCLFRWVFCIEFDLRTGKLPEKKCLGKCFFAPSYEGSHENKVVPF